VQDFKYSVVANLPYGVTSLLFRNLLTLSPRPTRITAMIQKEVAERMVAEPGEMSLLSLMMHYYATPTFVMTVPKTSFWPAPEVTSAVIDVQVTNPPPAADEGKALFRVAKAAFSGRRKTILNSLLASFPQEKANLSQKIEKAGLSPTARPQDLSLQNWIELSKVLI
jgi:16S rRNA (adenine1518-N6/adenine1519-N6)-dimethyltransferase